MKGSTIEALTNAWGAAAAEAGLRADYDGEPTPDVHAALELLQDEIREHIVATEDMRLLGFLHLLGHAALRLEEVLWPDEYEHIKREIAEGLRAAGGTYRTDGRTI